MIWIHLQGLDLCHIRVIVQYWLPKKSMLLYNIHFTCAGYNSSIQATAILLVEKTYFSKPELEHCTSIFCTWAQPLGWLPSHQGPCTWSQLLGGIQVVIPAGEPFSPALKTIYINSDHVITWWSPVNKEFKSRFGHVTHMWHIWRHTFSKPYVDFVCISSIMSGTIKKRLETLEVRTMQK